MEQGHAPVNTSVAPAEVIVSFDSVELPGTLTVPRNASGLVVFAHGSGSSRLSSRNVAVAATLVERGCATLLFDLLTDAEAADRRNVFDIGLLGRRVSGVIGWAGDRPDTAGLPVGCFGASTGAAAALVAAAERPDDVAAVVSRGGRPDLAGDSLPRVSAHTLLLVGSLDVDVLELNEKARQRLRGRTELRVIEGAGHLFEEPGTLEQVADAAGLWFVDSFGST